MYVPTIRGRLHHPVPAAALAAAGDRGRVRVLLLPEFCPGGGFEVRPGGGMGHRAVLIVFTGGEICEGLHPAVSLLQ